MRRHVLLILGMHRSGTSALAGAIVKAGANPGRTPSPTSSDLPEGSWENPRLREFNDEILRRLGARWDSVVPLPEGWTKGDEIEAMRAKGRALFADEFGDARLAVIKDPRICRLLPYWRTTLDEAGLTVSCALIVRRPLEVTGSLARRDQFAPEKSLTLWLTHLAAAERDSRGLPRAFLTYDTLLADWDAALSRIRTDAAFPLRSSAAQKEAVAAHVRPELNRQRRAIAARPAIASGMASALDTVLEAGYAKLVALAAGTDPRATIEALATSAATALSAAVPPWLAHELAATQALAQSLANEVDTARARINTLAAEMDTSRKAQAVRDGKEPERRRSDGAPITPAEFAAFTEALRAEMTGLSSALATATSAQQEAHAQQMRAERELADERSTIARLATEIDLARGAAQSQDGDLQLARAQVAEMLREFERARAEYAARDAEYAVRDAQHRERADDLEVARHDLVGVIADRDALKRARDEAAIAGSRAMAETDALRRDLAIRESQRASLAAAVERCEGAIEALSAELERRGAAERALLADRDRLGALEREARERIAVLERDLLSVTTDAQALRERLTAATSELSELDGRWLGRLARRQSHS